MYDLSLRELEVRLSIDLLARWFAGYQLFDDLPDHCTLQRFEIWVAHYQKRICFEEVLQQIEADYPDERSNGLPAKEQGTFRIGSATDPEATYRVHGPDPEDTSFGYNVQVAMTTSGLIRETKAYTGAEPDQAGVAKLIAEQKSNLGGVSAQVDLRSGCRTWQDACRSRMGF